MSKEKKVPINVSILYRDLSEKKSTIRVINFAHALIYVKGFIFVLLMVRYLNE